MATYIVDSTGSNDAEIIGDFTTDAVNKIVTFNAGTEGEAKPLKALETTRQWLVVEVREVEGVAGAIGKHVYSENVTDIQTRVEAIRLEMTGIHIFFKITATHYKTDDICDVYRGDQSTAVALAPDDTSIVYTPPAVWVIDDLTPFSPTTPVADNNLVVDPTCDNPADWDNPAGISITGGKMEVNNSTGTGARIQGDITELPVAGQYRVSGDVEAGNSVGWRFYIGNNAGPFIYNSGGTIEQVITYSTGPQTFGVQALDGAIMTMDNFSVLKV